MSERNIAITLGPSKKRLDYNTVSPIFYDGAGRPHLLVQAKQDGKKFALLLRLEANDIWLEVARDMAIWGEVALVQRPGGSAFLDGQTRDLQKHLSADVPWVPTVTLEAFHALTKQVLDLSTTVAKLQATLAGGTPL